MPQDYSACFPNSTPPTLYTNTGTTTAYPIGFPYQKTSDVVVYIGNASGTPPTWTIVPTTDYSISGNPSQVIFNSAPGQDVLIMRRTELCGERIEFQAGQSIRAQDLNTNFQQQLFLSQEIYEYLVAQQGGGPLIPGGSQDQAYLKPEDVLGGTGITATPGGGNVVISQETLSPNPAGTYLSANIEIDSMGRVISASNGSGGGGGGNVELVANISALDAAFPTAEVGAFYRVTNSTGAVGANPQIAGLPDPSTVNGGYGANVQITVTRAVADWTFLALSYPNSDTRYVNIDGDTMTGLLTLSGDPTTALQAATRQYVDNTASANDTTITLNAGTNLTGGGSFTLNQTTPATITFNASGSSFNGGEVTTSITTPERTITGTFDMSTGPYWTCGAIAIPNPTNAVSGMSGTIRVTAAPTSWDTNFSTAPTPTVFPSIIPFYVESPTSIRLGQAVGVA